MYTARAKRRRGDLDGARDALITTLSHELRTPLASVHGAALTVRYRREELSDAREDELLELIVAESARLGDIVEDIMLASHLGSGQIQLHVEPCDARGLALAVVERERGRDVPISFVAPAFLPEVLADQELFQQVLASLIDNAVKYSAGTHGIEIRLERNETLHLSVRDQGVGIARYDADRVFEKFSRLDPEQINGIGGVGLGLYIARQLVERMGGRLRVLSDLGQGSTFCVELPFAPRGRHGRVRSSPRRWLRRRRRRVRARPAATGA